MGVHHFQPSKIWRTLRVERKDQHWNSAPFDSTYSHDSENAGILSWTTDSESITKLTRSVWVCVCWRQKRLTFCQLVENLSIYSDWLIGRELPQSLGLELMIDSSLSWFLSHTWLCVCVWETFLTCGCGWQTEVGGGAGCIPTLEKSSHTPGQSAYDSEQAWLFKQPLSIQ